MRQTGSNMFFLLRLAPGNYTVHEDAPPTGYKIALDIEFAIDEEGNVKVKLYVRHGRSLLKARLQSSAEPLIHHERFDWNTEGYNKTVVEPPVPISSPLSKRVQTLCG